MFMRTLSHSNPVTECLPGHLWLRPTDCSIQQKLVKDDMVPVLVMHLGEQFFSKLSLCKYIKEFLYSCQY